MYVLISSCYNFRSIKTYKLQNCKSELTEFRQTHSEDIVAFISFLLLFQHQQQVAAAVERAKQVTMTELNAIIGVRLFVQYNILCVVELNCADISLTHP